MFFGIDRISENGGADVLEMDADLVGAAGVKMTENEGGFGGLVGGDDFVIGDRGFSTGRVDHGHFLSIHRMSTDMREDRVFVFQGDAVGDGEIDFFHAGALGKLGGQALVGGVGFGDDEAS